MKLRASERIAKDESDLPQTHEGHPWASAEAALSGDNGVKDVLDLRQVMSDTTQNRVAPRDLRP